MILPASNLMIDSNRMSDGDSTTIDVPFGYRLIDFAVPPPKYTPCDLSQFALTTCSSSSSSPPPPPSQSSTSASSSMFPALCNLPAGCVNSTKLNSQSAAELARQLQLRRSSLDSDPDSISAGGSSTELPPAGQLKATDSLLLLTQLDANMSSMGKESISASESDTDSAEVSSHSIKFCRSLGTEVDEDDDDEDDEEELDDQAAEREANQLVIEVNAREMAALGQTQLNVLETGRIRPSSPPLTIESNINGVLSNGRSRLSVDIERLPSPGKIIRSASSFGLHNSIENLKELDQSDTFDIIDLTAIPPPPEPISSSRSSVYIAHHPNILAHTCQDPLRTDYIDSFIASFQIHPPPNPVPLTSDLDVSDLIVIPPPPDVQPFLHEQDELLSRFRKATEDMKRICNSRNHDSLTLDESSTSEKDSLRSLSNVSMQLYTGAGRDLNSAGSADSGYESVVVNQSIQVPADSPSLASVSNYANVIGSASSHRSPKVPTRRSDSLPIEVDNQGAFTIALNELIRLQEEIRTITAFEIPPNLISNFEIYRRSLSQHLARHPDSSWNETLVSLQSLESLHTSLQCESNDSFLTSIREQWIQTCRQFVTSSKMFVKSATEQADPSLPDHLAACIFQLQKLSFLAIRMNAAASSTSSNGGSLILNLGRVLRTYLFTVQTVRQLRTHHFESSALQASQLNLLMEHATELATALSALMKSFRD